MVLGYPLQWRHNEHNGVSNHRHVNCVHNRLFRRRSKKTSKLRVTDLWEGNSPVTVNFPHKGTVTRSFHVYIWWRHHDQCSRATWFCMQISTVITSSRFPIIIVFLNAKSQVISSSSSQDDIVQTKPDPLLHEDVINWKHYPGYWPFVIGIHRSPVDSLHKGQCRGALVVSLICAWTNGWPNNRDAGDLRRHRGHYDVTVTFLTENVSEVGNSALIARPTTMGPVITEMWPWKKFWRKERRRIRKRRKNSGKRNIQPESSLQWRHNERDGVSNHQPYACLLNRLFRRRSKKTSKVRVTGLCKGNSPGPVNSPHKWPVTRKMFPFDDVIM